MAKRKDDSLFEWADRQPAAPPGPGELALRAGFEDALAKFAGEPERDGAALIRYFDRLHATWNSIGDLRKRTWAVALLGAYFAKGMRKKRNLGRPRSPLPPLFTHVWHELNLKRVAAGLPPLVPTVPAKEIAAEIARAGWGSFTAKQVSDTLGKAPEWRDLVLSGNYGEKIDS